MRAPLLALLLVACPSPEEPESDHRLVVEAYSDASAAGDPLGIVFAVESRNEDGRWDDPCVAVDDTWCGRDLSEAVPRLMSPEGRVEEAPAWISAAGAFIDYTLPYGASPGRWRLVGASGIDLPLASTVEFDVVDWGAADPFDPTAANGTWEVVDWHTAPIDANGLFEVPAAWAVVDGATTVAADLQIVAQAEGGPCVLFRARPTWEGSALVYDTPRLSVEHPELGELVAEDVRIEMAWSSAGWEVARGRVDGLVDTYNLDPLINESAPGSGEVCGLAEAIGGACEDCADGEPDCIGVHVTRIELRETDLVLADLPLCGVDAFGEVPTLSCDTPDLDFSCDGVGCSHAGRAYGWLGALLLPWLVRRRRDVAAVDG